MVADPAPLAVTSPLVLTVATDEALVPQVIDRPERIFPAASRSVGVSCVIPPTVKLAEVGLNATVATATTDTVNCDWPVCPSDVAVIVAVPSATPLTTPDVVTVATLLFDVVQVTVRPDSGLPRASLGVAVNCTTVPMTTTGELGVTVTPATGT